MDTYGKQHLFDEDTIRLFFLSPYAEVREMEDEIFLMRRESDKAVTLPRWAGSSMLLEMLRNGAEEKILKEELSAILGKEGEEWLYACIWEGIIE